MAKKRKYNGHANEDEILTPYFKEIDNEPLLDYEQEKDCAFKYSQGDNSARKTLIKSNLRLVVKIAKSFQNSRISFYDLIQEGNIGLMKSVERYDPEKHPGIRFSTYASWWIRQSIIKAIYETSGAIRLPYREGHLVSRINKLEKDLIKQYGPANYTNEIAEYMDKDPEEINHLKNICEPLVSFETPLPTGEPGDTSIPLGNSIEATNYSTPEKQTIEKSLTEEINEVLGTLSEREAIILEHRFGLNGKKPMTLKKIGELFNLSKERIRQIEMRALKRLKHPSRSENLKVYLKN